MKNKSIKISYLNLVFACLFSASVPFIILFASGKHQDVKESEFQIIDTFKVTDCFPDIDDSTTIINVLTDKKDWINYYPSKRKFVKGYDEIYYSVKK